MTKVRLIGVNRNFESQEQLDEYIKGKHKAQEIMQGDFEKLEFGALKIDGIEFNQDGSITIDDETTLSPGEQEWETICQRYLWAKAGWKGLLDGT